MSPRRRPPRHGPPAVVPSLARNRVETGHDGEDYEVRPIPGSRALKTYRCPGCDHEIRSGTPHVVVWPVDAVLAGVDERRHWHTPCWAHRSKRGPTRKWS